MSRPRTGLRSNQYHNSDSTARHARHALDTRSIAGTRLSWETTLASYSKPSSMPGTSKPHVSHHRRCRSRSTAGRTRTHHPRHAGELSVAVVWRATSSTFRSLFDDDAFDVDGRRPVSVFHRRRLGRVGVLEAFRVPADERPPPSHARTVASNQSMRILMVPPIHRSHDVSRR